MAQPLAYGRSDRIRTYDPYTPSVVRYQTALRSDKSNTSKVRKRREYTRWQAALQRLKVLRKRFFQLVADGFQFGDQSAQRRRIQAGRLTGGGRVRFRLRLRRGLGFRW